MFEKKNLLLIVVYAALFCMVSALCLFIGWGVWNTYQRQTAPAGEPSNQPGVSIPFLPSAVPLPTATPAPDPRPVGFYEGLASLNSYKLKIRTLFTGPKAVDYNENISTTSYNQNGDQLYTKVENTSSSEDEPTKKTTVSEQYRLGQKYCQRSTSDGETESELSEASPLQQTMTDAIFNLFDITVATKDAKFIGAETINGVPANHFTFTVSGLGTSGAEVTQSQGEYWVAQDGQYLVKYRVTMEMRSGPAGDPKTETIHVEIQTEVSEINTAITVQMPPDCK
jgi:hypothetical protein